MRGYEGTTVAGLPGFLPTAGGCHSLLRRGVTSELFDVEDPAFTANCLYTQTIGMMHMARIGLGVTQTVPVVPEVFAIDASRVHEACVSTALAVVGLPSPPPPGQPQPPSASSSGGG